MNAAIEYVLMMAWMKRNENHSGAPDAERDIRGAAMKFYTEEGNWDLVGNNMRGVVGPEAIQKAVSISIER